MTEAPPRRRLQHTDAIVSLFEGSAASQRPHGGKHAPVAAPRRHAGKEHGPAEARSHHHDGAGGDAPSGNVEADAPTAVAASGVSVQHQSQQTDTLARDFRLLELVLNTPASAHHGVVTREHAAHRAMLERQIATRIVDARTDERYVRDAIENAHAEILQAMAAAWRFHAAAMRDALHPEGRPALVLGEEHQRVLGINDQLRDRVDLLERRLRAGERGVHFLPTTVRFAPPPPCYEALEKEEAALRRQLVALQEGLFASAADTWGMTPRALLLMQQRGAQQLQRQRMGMTPAQVLAAEADSLCAREEAARAAVADEEQGAFGAASREAAALLSAMLRRTAQEKELYRWRAEELALVASEAAARAALEAALLSVYDDALARGQQEMLAKAELSRRLRGSLQQQHQQHLRHKQDLDVLLPPVSSRASTTAARMSAVAATLQRERERGRHIPPDASVPAAVRSHYAPTDANLVDNITDSLIRSTVAEARKAAASALIGGVASGEGSARAATGSAQQSMRAASSTKLPAIAESARKPIVPPKERAPLYNAGFSRPYRSLGF